MRSGHTGSTDRGRWKAALLLGVALFAALPLLLVGFELWRDRAEIAASGERSAENLARLLHEQTARTVQAVDLTLTGMIDTLRLTPGLREHDAAFEHALRQRLAELPYVRALFVIGPDGFITQDSDHPKTPRVSLADRDYFIAHMTDPDIGLHIGPPLRSRSVGVWFVSMSRRIDRPDGGFGGIAVAAVEPRYFERFYTELQLGEGDNIALLSRDGLLIARNPHQDDAIGRSLADTDLFRRHLPGSPAGTFRARSAVDGVPRVFSYRTVDAWPLVVLVGLDEQALFADWRTTAAGASIAGGVFAALVASIAVLLLRQWRRREEVRERMAQVQRLEALGQMTAGSHTISTIC